MDHRVRRLIASHGLSAVAMATPWPALLAAVWASTGSEVWLAVVGAARMAPYVVLSWAAGSLGDRFPRVRVVRVTTSVRLVLLASTALFLLADQVLVATVFATMVVAAGTPAYPALAAGMPALAGRDAESATRWLVTFEVSAFVVGPAIGGLLLGLFGTTVSAASAVAIAAVAFVLLRGVTDAQTETRAAADMTSRRESLRVLLGTQSALRAILAVAVVNGVIGALGVGLLMVAEEAWSAGDQEFGYATAALGFGSLATPLVARLLRMRATAVLLALVLTAAPLVAVTLAPAWGWALLPLALVGVGATQVECAATAVIQTSVPDHARAFALGVTDTAMVSVALAGAAAAPLIVAATSAQTLVILLLLVTTVVALVLVSWRPVLAADDGAARPPEANTGAGATRSEPMTTAL